ncbi:hypothetical protein phytr_280 [Candidatus Phycorickettsia trachydisci]|uniref:DUF721 domain-containing protein n=1 Tax=Candidatus Phycorickettsia trachydisci TaxID=2115978 RepID=A0A2P1P6V6_9RICK|nr:DciA family protein [Candidatus Phycorickettsia trachydisci]AVP86991.1 hypothetical protein phytr_280 [Candidatus Phycorickettsia trachydisci]
MQRIEQVINGAIEKVMFKRHGKAFAKIFANWSNLCSPSLASISVPLSLNKIDKVLFISSHNPAKAIELYFMQEVILQRIKLLLDSHGIKQKIDKIHVQKYEF